MGARHLSEPGKVLELTDRTVVVEVDDAAIALALNLAPQVEVELDIGGVVRTVRARPGQRSSDIPSSHRVELVLQEVL